MIKAILKQKDLPDLILLGLSEKNIEKLKEGKPILIKDFGGVPYHIGIMYGKTEAEIEKIIKEALK